MTTPAEVAAVVAESLDYAEKVWARVGKRLIEEGKFAAAREAEGVPSRIPNHPLVVVGQEKAERFVAFMADMRESTKHLTQAIGKPARASELQRVYYETSALLPAIEHIVNANRGSVTEYLGDGLLALFPAEDDMPKGIYSAYDAAFASMTVGRRVVNEALTARYCLPAVDFGIGLAMGRALVGAVGLPGRRFPNVFGKCIYRCSRLCRGRNEIIVDDDLKAAWPSAPSGKLSFRLSKQYDTEFSGYVVLENGDGAR